MQISAPTLTDSNKSPSLPTEVDQETFWTCNMSNPTVTSASNIYNRTYDCDAYNEKKL